LILGVLATAYLAFTLVVMAPWPAAIIGIGLVLARVARKKHQLFAHGTARWADHSDLERAGMLGGESGLILGRVDGRRPGFWTSLNALFDRRVPSAKACEQFVMSIRKVAPPPPPALVRLANAVHSVIFAPAGAGKSTGMAIPFLLDCKDACLVTDLKGELATITAEHRRRMGHRVVVLDPFHVVTPTPDCFNPLDTIDKDSPQALDDCRDFAQAVVVRTGEEKERNWDDNAESLIAGLTAATCLYAEGVNRSVQTVRTLLTDPVKMQATIKLMCDSDAWEGMLSRIGHQLTHLKDKELASVVTNANRHMGFLDTLAVAASTRTSSFNPAELRGGKLTIYLVLPPDRMRTQAGLLRMWIGASLRAVVRGGLQEQNKVHFVLDEAASLGRLEVLEDAVSVLRGYGVRMQFYYQSLGQLKKAWPEGQDQTLLSNTSQVFFGVNDPQTAEYVSNRLGEETIVVDSGGTSKGSSFQASNPDSGTSRGTSWNSNDNWSLVGRKLLKPEEIAGLDKRVAITFTPGIPPLATRLVPYYAESPGNGPGRLRRLRTRVEVWLVAIILLGLASFLGMRMTAVLTHPHYQSSYGVAR
jgi:type IV secretion system protein VirD4